jgi:hypothetical protein
MAASPDSISVALRRTRLSMCIACRFLQPTAVAIGLAPAVRHHDRPIRRAKPTQTGKPLKTAAFCIKLHQKVKAALHARYSAAPGSAQTGNPLKTAASCIKKSRQLPYAQLGSEAHGKRPSPPAASSPMAAQRSLPSSAKSGKESRSMDSERTRTRCPSREMTHSTSSPT